MNYISLIDAIKIHDTIIENYWGLEWIKDKWQLDSLLSHIQNDDYYSNIIEKISHLFFWLIQFHMFNDWNKRTSIIITSFFLDINNIIIDDYVIKMEDLAIWEIGKEDLNKIFKSMFLSFWY
jgi:death-on-curing protein